MENVGERIRCLPSSSQIGSEIHLLVAADQTAENQIMHMLRISIGADAWIEIRRHGLDQEVECAGFFAPCGVRTAKKNERDSERGKGRDPAARRGISEGAHSKSCRAPQASSRPSPREDYSR